jgi:membrane protein YqaA with SNARE-associated domain
MSVRYDKEKYGWHFHRYLYDWVLSWADSPLGEWALFILALAESSFFPIPPDVLLIALILSARRKAFRYALICSIASIVGGMLGYFIGYELWYSGDGYSGIAEFFFLYIPGFTMENFLAAKSWYDIYSFWIVFTAGFTPIPYKVITITAGVAQISITMFFIASIISRTLRFFLIAWLIWRFGAPIKDFIEMRFNLLTIVFVLLLIGGFILIKYVY